MKQLSIAEIKRRLSGIGEVSGRRCYMHGCPVPWDAQYSYPRPVDCIHSKGYEQLEPNRRRVTVCAAEIDIDGMPHVHRSGKSWRKTWNALYEDIHQALKRAVDEIEGEQGMS